MIESALGSIIGSILGGGAAVTPKKVKDEEPKPVPVQEESDAINLKELTPAQKSDLELALVMSGLSTPNLKKLMTQDSIDSSLLGGLAKIFGIPSKSKTLTTPLEDEKTPKTETMPLGEARNKDTSIKGEKEKDKTYTTKGEEAKNKSTVMEIPEEDLDRLIEMAYSDWSEKNPKLMEVARQIAMKNKMHVKDVLAQGKKVYDERYQKKLDDEMKQHDAGRIDYEKKLKNPKLKEDTEKAAEKYKAETPDYKYDDIKRNKEAKGEKYTGERHSGKPSEEALRKADDFVTKNAGRDYEARLDRAQNKTSIYRPGK